MSNEKNEIMALKDMPVSSSGLQPTRGEHISGLAKMYVDSGLAPKGMDTAQKVFMAISLGLEVGLTPLQAVQNVAVINGRATIWGDSMLALCRKNQACYEVTEFATGKKYDDDYAWTCKAIRRREDGSLESPTVRTFSVGDAKRAGLWGKGGPWQSYPDRMLQQRARGFALRDAFPDLLKGLISKEEADDYPTKEPKAVAVETVKEKSDDAKKKIGDFFTKPTIQEAEIIGGVTPTADLPAEPEPEPNQSQATSNQSGSAHTEPEDGSDILLPVKDKTRENALADIDEMMRSFGVKAEQLNDIIRDVTKRPLNIYNKEIKTGDLIEIKKSLKELCKIKASKRQV